MRSSRLLTSFLLVLPSVVACSGGGNDKPDAFVVVADAKPDAPPLPPGCDAQELSDLTNDTFEVGAAEDTMLTFTASSTICGKANASHFEAPTMAGDIGVVDVDSYKITLAAPAVVYVTFGGAGLETLTGNFRIYDRSKPMNEQLQLFGEMHRGHTASHVSLPAGAYELQAIVLGDAAPSGDVSYKIKMVTETPDTRCPYLTTGGYAEAADGATNVGNDMIAWDYEAVDPAPNITLTTTTADNPEPTGITAAAGTTYRVSGTSANNPVGATDDYKDRDTFKFTTGPTTDEVTIRMKFPLATMDIDVLLAEEAMAGETEPAVLDISNRLAAGPSEEFITTAVEPNTVYWLWIAGYKDHPPGMAASTAGTYDATICPSVYVP